jgi:hypothetical protein
LLLGLVTLVCNGCARGASLLKHSEHGLALCWGQLTL